MRSTRRAIWLLVPGPFFKLWRESLIDDCKSTTHANKKSPEESSGLEKSVMLHDVPEAGFTKEAIAGSG